ncbi:MAG TPA: phospholipid carrier-dependent glycosyltransferase, partial [Trebonia sp.]|nr:phospholipid carrier-dependent glycosyltransferase [Trebonia sp.]
MRIPGAERIPWALLAVLAVQAALSASMVRASTAFGDEALYLSAGHLEWSHWLHGTPIPAYQTYFSGAPVLYPPTGAIADSVGGLAAARLLSLVFMLGVTSLVWCTARRLLADERAAFFAAALFAVLAPTLHLGSFATYDAAALLLLTAAAWCAAGVRSAPGVRSAAGDRGARGARGGGRPWRWMIAAGILLALANATKYATALYDPTVLGVAFLSSWPDDGWKAALRRAALVAGVAAALIALLLALGGPGYLTGIRITTTGRVDGDNGASLVFAQAWSWTAVVLVPAVAGAVVCALRRRWPQALLLATLALSALLAPADQARIQTVTSLNKHVDFGAWFAAIAAGYLLSLLSRRRVVLAAALAALLPVTALGTAQARAMIDWPGAAGLVTVVRPMTSHGGHFLVETTDV